jgi:hypothetical protein
MNKSFLVLFFKKELLAFFVVFLMCIVRSAFAENPLSAGARLYNGAAPLTGMIYGQNATMPASVLVCANCHVGRPGQAGGDARAAPDLRGGWLRKILSRRNGPAGRYTQAGFCRALRSGIDPRYVMLPVQMPRFTISDNDCAALWAYLDAPA